MQGGALSTLVLLAVVCCLPSADPGAAHTSAFPVRRVGVRPVVHHARVVAKVAVEAIISS